MTSTPGAIVWSRPGVSNLLVRLASQPVSSVICSIAALCPHAFLFLMNRMYPAEVTRLGFGCRGRWSWTCVQTQLVSSTLQSTLSSAHSSTRLRLQTSSCGVLAADFQTACSTKCLVCPDHSILCFHYFSARPTASAQKFATCHSESRLCRGKGCGSSWGPWGHCLP